MKNNNVIVLQYPQSHFSIRHGCYAFAFVSLSVYPQNDSKSCRRVLVEIFYRVEIATNNNWLDFHDDPNFQAEFLSVRDRDSKNFASNSINND